MICNLCPRNCGVDREKVLGFCNMKSTLKIAHYELFKFEEPCISVGKGSGAIFFSGCNLNCVFCQNYDISTCGKGKEFSILEFIDIIKELENAGAENINLVSPMHYALQIIEALKIYKPKVPVIYNTNAYEKVEVIKALANYVDVFLPDFKYVSGNLSKRFSNAEDYFDVALSAIKTMRKLKQDKYMGDKIVEGVIIRHMILPLCADDSIAVLKNIKQNFPTTKVSLLAQYTPYGKACEIKQIARKITKREYNRVLEQYINLGLDGYVQDLSSATCDYIPKFKFID